MCLSEKEFVALFVFAFDLNSLPSTLRIFASPVRRHFLLLLLFSPPISSSVDSFVSSFFQF